MGFWRRLNWYSSAVAVVLLFLMIIACNQTEGNTQLLSDSSETLSGDTGSQGSEVSVDGMQVPPRDPPVDFAYVEWVLENPAAQFVGLWTPDPVPSLSGYTDEAIAGFLWIEYPCVYLRDPEPIPLDIQAVADLDLDLEKAVSEIASWPPTPTGFPFSRWVPADVQVVYESEPAHRILLRLPRDPSTFYDQETGKLWVGRWDHGSRVSGDLVAVETNVVGLSDEYRNLGCDARAQLKISRFFRESVSDWYSRWR